ncbi:MAG: dockerin type I domain-containing protein, partial [Defluviitaleaceae bacterium]|nr:dockerin type I domain-containing protein [Defluviitaleaceae bacterium]
VNASNATRAGGIARSLDGGVTWTSSILGDVGDLLSDPNNSGLPRRSIISSIIFDPVNRDVVYVLSSGAGVYRSTNGGVTFTPHNQGIALQTHGAFQGIAGTMRLGRDGSTLLLVNDGIIYQLDIANQAGAWTALNGPPDAIVERVEKTREGVLYVTTQLQQISSGRIPFGDGGTRADIGLGGVFVSTDNGHTWRQIFTDMYHVTDIVSASRNSDILYLASREGKVYASARGSRTVHTDWVRLDGFNFHHPKNIFENPLNNKSIIVSSHCGGTWDVVIPFDDPIPQNTATLRVSFQGRTAPQGPANIERLDVVWAWTSNGNTFIAEEIVSTDHNGEAQITLPPASESSGLTIWVKGERTLAVSRNIEKIEPGSTINVGVLLGGDANGDNEVDLNDLSIFMNNYGRNSSSPGFNRLADFNNDGEVDLNDLSILVSNYGRRGAPRPTLP